MQTILMLSGGITRENRPCNWPFFINILRNNDAGNHKAVFCCCSFQQKQLLLQKEYHNTSEPNLNGMNWRLKAKLPAELSNSSRSTDNTCNNRTPLGGSTCTSQRLIVVGTSDTLDTVCYLSQLYCYCTLFRLYWESLMPYDQHYSTLYVHIKQ